MYRKYGKRIMDVAGALAGLLLLWPLLVLTGVLVRIKLGSPVIFKQERPGKDEKIFVLYKFRSMTEKRGKDGKLLPDKERLTKFGRLLRSTSLDELPELINIVKGDMSIVGPRPLLAEYLPLYSEEQRRRHEVRPGLTGLAQVNGRNGISWEEKLAFDRTYVDSICFTRDIWIIMETIKKVFRREGIHSETSATMEFFCGTETRETEGEK